MFKSIIFILCISATFMAKDLTIASTSTKSVYNNLPRKSNLKVLPPLQNSAPTRTLIGRKNDLPSGNPIQIDFDKVLQNIEKIENKQKISPHFTTPSKNTRKMTSNSPNQPRQNKRIILPPLLTSVKNTVSTNKNDKNPPKKQQFASSLTPNTSTSAIKLNISKSPSNITTDDNINTLRELQNKFLSNLKSIKCNNHLSTFEGHLTPRQLENKKQLIKQSIISQLTNKPINKTESNNDIKIMCNAITEWQNNQNRSYPIFPYLDSLETLTDLCNANVEYANLNNRTGARYFRIIQNESVLDQIIENTHSFINKKQYTDAVRCLNQVAFFLKPFTTLDIIISEEKNEYRNTQHAKLDLRIQGYLLDFTPLGVKADPHKKGIAFDPSSKLISQFILNQINILLIGINQYIEKADSLMIVLLRKVPDFSKENNISIIKNQLNKQYQIWKKMSPILYKIYPIDIPDANWIPTV